MFQPERLVVAAYELSKGVEFAKARAGALIGQNLAVDVAAIARKSLIETILAAQKDRELEQGSDAMATPTILKHSQSCCLHLCFYHRTAFRPDPAHFELLDVLGRSGKHQASQLSKRCAQAL